MIQYQLEQEAVKHRNLIQILANYINKYWFKSVLILFALHILINKDFSIQVNMSDKENINNTEQIAQPASYKENERDESTAQPVKLKEKVVTQNSLGATFGSIGASSSRKWSSDNFSNLTFILNPNLASKKDVPLEIVEEKLNQCQKYVERFAAVAIAEQKKFGIPASIKLAQGLLETNAGASKLANESNNHFGIKCKAKCEGCTCRNYEDDDKYDMFRVFDTAWESFRAHSTFLERERYQHLKQYKVTDYKNWANGLKEAGYATDKNYSKKLIRIIETLDLYQFDR